MIPYAKPEGVFARNDKKDRGMVVAVRWIRSCHIFLVMYSHCDGFHRKIVILVGAWELRVHCHCGNQV